MKTNEVASDVESQLMQIDPETLKESLKTTKKVFNVSSALSVIENIEYNHRRRSFSEFIPSNTGYTTFVPVVETKVVNIFLEKFEEVVGYLSSFYRPFRTVEGKELVNKNLYIVARRIADNITPENILENTIPSAVSRKIEQLEWPEDRKIQNNLKGFSSPKLSKLISKVSSEAGDFVKWYTNDCPKKISVGENPDYRITVSVLPHHIAGMSYYSCYNFGGQEWNGWEGTSCQDPKRNGRGSSIPQLVASVKDETLAVAYLSKAENDDPFKPVYEARALVRIVEMSNGKNFLIVLRQFGYYSSNALLVEGLKAKYQNKILINEEISEMSGQNLIIKFPLFNDVSFRFEDNEEKCSDCDGTGIFRNWGDENPCRACDATGKANSRSYYPYNDDFPIWHIYGDETMSDEYSISNDEVEKRGKFITYKIPIQLLTERKLYDKVKTVSKVEKTEETQDSFRRIGVADDEEENVTRGATFDLANLNFETLDLEINPRILEAPRATINVNVEELRFREIQLW